MGQLRLLSGRFRGRPRLLNADSKPNVAARVICESSAPNDCCLAMRTALGTISRRERGRRFRCNHSTPHPIDTVLSESKIKRCQEPFRGAWRAGFSVPLLSPPLTHPPYILRCDGYASTFPVDLLRNLLRQHETAAHLRVPSDRWYILQQPAISTRLLPSMSRRTESSPTV